MSKREFRFTCPNCSVAGSVKGIFLEVPESFFTWCQTCYYPLDIYPIEERSEIAKQKIEKRAFLIHSSDKKEKSILDYFRALLKLYGIETFIIETDTRPVDWLQKSLDGINNADFVIAFLTKRYQFANDLGEISGWKAPDKCYEEIAIAFALQKRILALVESEVESGNVLSTRAWCYGFTRTECEKGSCPIKIDSEFFTQLLTMLGYSEG
jgi:hypothetical protein